MYASFFRYVALLAFRARSVILRENFTMFLFETECERNDIVKVYIRHNIYKARCKSVKNKDNRKTNTR